MTSQGLPDRLLVILIYQISYVPLKYCDVIFRYQPGDSLDTSLNACLDSIVTQAEERMGVIAAPDRVAPYLKIVPGSPCLFSERISKHAAGKPVVFDEDAP